MNDSEKQKRLEGVFYFMQRRVLECLEKEPATGTLHDLSSRVFSVVESVRDYIQENFLDVGIIGNSVRFNVESEELIRFDVVNGFGGYLAGVLEPFLYLQYVKEGQVLFSIVGGLAFSRTVSFGPLLGSDELFLNGSCIACAFPKEKVGCETFLLCETFSSALDTRLLESSLLMQGDRYFHIPALGGSFLGLLNGSTSGIFYGGNDTFSASLFRDIILRAGGEVCDFFGKSDFLDDYICKNGVFYGVPGSKSFALDVLSRCF